MNMEQALRNPEDPSMNHPGFIWDFIGKIGAPIFAGIGALAGGGNLGSIELIYVPEPSTMLLTATALAGIFISATGLKRRQCIEL